MKNLINRKVVLPLLMTFNFLSTTIAFPVYANPSWTERLVYSIDNDTFVIGESEWFENKYDAFQSAFLDGLNKINVMQNTEIETTYIEKAYNGKVTSEEFSTIKSSNDFGEIVIKILLVKKRKYLVCIVYSFFFKFFLRKIGLILQDGLLKSKIYFLLNKGEIYGYVNFTYYRS